LGALATGLGHVVVSLLLGVITVGAGEKWIPDFQEAVEHLGAAFLILFGFVYAIWAFRTHSHCVGHTHHGPKPARGSAPYFFLFTVGLSPCVAALPLFVASIGEGVGTFVMSLGAFAVGVLLALVSAVLLVRKGLMKLDHPLFEHYGDVLTGLGVVLVGVLLLVLPHGHG
jgi:cytochrome c biogenesis protein CcdA